VLEAVAAFETYRKMERHVKRGRRFELCDCPRRHWRLMAYYALCWMAYAVVVVAALS
jgi:hypothetical protein